MQKLRVAILGAGGVVGKTYLHLLKNHPYFAITYAASSVRSIGECIQGHILQCPDDINAIKDAADIVFSCLPKKAADTLEKLLQKAGLAVFTNASSHRLLKDTALVIPEINGEKILTSKNAPLIAKPNCSIQSILLSLYPLHREYTLKKLQVTSLQSVSGAGKSLSAAEITDNVIPWIAGEEEKAVAETYKILDCTFPFSISCMRIPTLHGHMAQISASFEKKPSLKNVVELWDTFRGYPQLHNLPSAPKKPVHYLEEIDRPQIRLDRDREQGMAVSVGRLKKSPLFDISFCALAHNTLRGAAGGGVLSAELYYHAHYVMQDLQLL